MAKATWTGNQELASSAGQAMIAIALAAMLLAVVLGVLIARSLATPVSALVSAARRMAGGDLQVEVKVDRKDELGELAGSFSEMIEAVKALAGDVNTLAAAALEGKLATRAQAAEHQGDYRQIVESINQLLDAVVGPLNVAAGYVDRISKGDNPPPITDTYRGDFNALKQNLNVLVDAMDRVTAVAREIAAGNLQVEVRERSERDELMRALDGMVRKLTEVVQGVKSASDNVAVGSQQLSASAEQMSQGATEQAAAVEEVSSSMEQMSSNIRQNADNASQTEKIALKAADGRPRGRRGGGQDGRGHEGDRRQDLDHRGDRAADQPAGPQRRHRGGPGRRARQGVRGGGLRGAEAGRAEPEGGGRDHRAVRHQRGGGREGRRAARQASCPTSRRPPSWCRRSPPPAASRTPAPTRSTRPSSSSTR